MSAEVVRLRIGNPRKAVLVTGQAYQEPKDAFNEFVSNADEMVRILVRLRRHMPRSAARRARSP
jgi:hypothetical protein